MNAVQKLRQMVGEIAATTQPAPRQAAWDLVRRLLGRLSADLKEIDRVCTAQDVEGLSALVTRIENAEASPGPGTTAGGPASASQAHGVSERDMEMAYRAFRKRLKLARLSDESKLGGRQLTGGKQSEIDAILPPHEFPAEVWAALASAGKLKYVRDGFYALP